MVRLPVSVWIGNAAAVVVGGWGAVSRRAKEAGCSRQTVYEHAERVRQRVAEDQQGSPSREELLRENEELRQENRQLWEALEGAIEFPEAKQQQFAATGSAMGLSLSQIEELLALILPRPLCPSRATLGRWVQAWAKRAGEALRVLDQACQHLVLLLCLDEIFFHRQPVLVGVEPQSMAWLLGQRATDRSGATWSAALEPWSRLEYAVADAGTGLQAGLARRQEERQRQSQNPLETGLDVFHIKKEALPVLRRLWQRAESVWVKAEEADREVARCHKQGKNANGAANRARWAWRKAEEAFHNAERVEEAWRQAEQALEIFRPDGRLNDRAWAEAQIAAAVPRLPGAEWSKVRRMLADPRSLTFLDRMHRQLQEAVPEEGLREELVRLYWLRRQRRPPADASAAADAFSLLYVVQKTICARCDAQWLPSYRKVAEVLRRTVRASSVVECMNSVIRMHQARHRTLSQPLLDLKRLYWNCRGFREGKRRHACPYQHLGLRLPTHDWWALLQMPLEELTEKLSTQQVAA